jgi:hypothetical protein
LSGLLGLYVGLDYLSRSALLPRWNGGYEVIHALLGEAWPTEFLQDYSGTRALVFGGNAYETAGVDAARYVQFGSMALPSGVSTHPPTAFALLLPLAPFSFGVASAIWAALMLAGLIVAVRICGAPWYIAALLGPLLILAPPVAAGVNHLAVPWLVLLLLAFQYRQRAGVAGVLIGLASLTKYLPGLLLMPLVARGRWRALGAFVLVWAICLALIGILNPGVLATYLNAGSATASVWLAEPSNGSFLLVPLRFGSWAEALALALLAWIIWLEVRDLRAGQVDDRMQWARWNWVAVALLPITWTYSVLPLALSVVLLFQQRQTGPMLIALAGFAPMLFAFDTASPFPPFFCTACVGLALAAQPLRWRIRPCRPATASPSASIVSSTSSTRSYPPA